MRKSDELKQFIAKQRAKVEDLQREERFDDAEAEAKLLNDAVRDYNVALALENAQFEDFTAGGAKPVNKTTERDEAKLRRRAFNRLVLADVVNFMEPSDQEKAVMEDFAALEVMDAAGTPGQVGATPAKGGYLIPTEQFNQIIEFRRTYQELKQYCTVRAAGSRKGTQPTIGQEDGELTAFEELNEIHQSDIDFGQIAYDCKDYGDIIPVARQLLQDIDVDLMGIIGQRFARKAINTENKKILAVVNGLTKKDLTDYMGIKTVLNTGLDPEISANATIFTNQSGFDYLDHLVDAQKRPLLTASLTDPAARLFSGRPVVVLKDTLLPTATKKLPFVIGSMADLVYFWDHVGVEVAVSDQAGFTKNAVLVRAIERFDVTKVDGDAMVFGQITTA